MDKYNVVLSASEEYAREVIFLICSFKEHNPIESFNIYVLSYDLSDSIKERIRQEGAIVEDIRWMEKEYENPFISPKSCCCMMGRLRFSADLEGPSTMIIDADYIFLNNIKPLMDLASLGYVVAAGAGIGYCWKRGFDGISKHPHFEFCQSEFPCKVNPIAEGYEDKLDDKWYPALVFPIILNTTKYKDMLVEMARVFKSHLNKYLVTKRKFDFLKDNWVMNSMIDAHVPEEMLFVIPSHQLGGMHSSVVRPDTGIMRENNKLMARDFSKVYAIHGKLFHGRTQEGYKVFIKYTYERDKELVRSRCENSLNLINEEVDRIRSKYESIRHLEM